MSTKTDALIKAVSAMREAQINYYLNHDAYKAKALLVTAKQAEKVVDVMLRHWNQPEDLNLFSDDSDRTRDTRATYEAIEQRR